MGGLVDCNGVFDLFIEVVCVILVVAAAVVVVFVVMFVLGEGRRLEVWLLVGLVYVV